MREWIDRAKLQAFICQPPYRRETDGHYYVQKPEQTAVRRAKYTLKTAVQMLLHHESTQFDSFQARFHLLWLFLRLLPPLMCNAIRHLPEFSQKNFLNPACRHSLTTLQSTHSLGEAEVVSSAALYHF